MRRVLSAGMGVQSSFLALAPDHGLLDKLDAAIMADTQREPDAVYSWVDTFMRPRMTTPLHVVTAGDLGAGSLRVIRSKKSGKLYQKNLIPLFVKSPEGKTPAYPSKFHGNTGIVINNEAYPPVFKEKQAWQK